MAVIPNSCFDTSSLDLHYPVVLKVSDPEILHKTEAGGVKTGIGDYSQLRIEFEKMFMKFPGKNFLIEEMISSGVEGMEYQLKENSSLFYTEDLKEGVKAFLEKRKANYKGR